MQKTQGATKRASYV